MSEKEIMELVKENMLLKFRIRQANEFIDNQQSNSNLNEFDKEGMIKSILNYGTIDKPIVDVWKGEYLY